MTGDPKRWADDASVADALREVLRDEAAREDGLAPPPMPEALRREMRARVVPVREAPSRRGWIFGAVGLAAAAAALFAVGRAPDAPPDPGQIRVVPEPIDAGHDAALPELHVERVCGDLEDSDLQCALVVDLPRAVSRLTVHRAMGRLAPPCEAPVEHERGALEAGSIRIEVSDGNVWWGLDAYRVCAWEGEHVIASGVVEGRRRGPQIQVAPRYDGDDVVIEHTLDAASFDLDVHGYALLRTPVPARDYESTGDRPEVGCDGVVVARWSHALLEGLRDAGEAGASRLTLAMRAPRREPFEEVPGFVVCAETDEGLVLADDPREGQVAWHVPWAVWPDEEPMIATPSGEVRASDVRDGHLLWSVEAPSADARWDEPPVLRVTRAQDRGPHAWIDEVAGWTFAGRRLTQPPVLDAAQRGLRLEGARLEGVSGTTEEAADPPSWRLRWRAAAPIFVNGIAVARSAAGGRTEASAPLVEAPIRAVPASRLASDCSLLTMLEIDALPEGVTEIGLAAQRHEGPPGALVPMACDDTTLVGSWPVALLRALPADARGVRSALVTTRVVPEGEDEIDEEDSYCSAGYAVLPCVRDASGMHGVEGVAGRWNETGPSCFAAGTEITTPAGTTPIEQLRAGDVVLAEAGTWVHVAALLARGEREVLRLTLDDGSVLRVTGEHPLRDADRDVFREAASFRVGDRLAGGDGAPRAIRGIARGGRAPVYDVSVEAPHTFVAGGVVAHNY